MHPRGQGSSTTDYYARFGAARVLNYAGVHDQSVNTMRQELQYP